jgi:hypothetical protein
MKMLRQILIKKAGFAPAFFLFFSISVQAAPLMAVLTQLVQSSPLVYKGRDVLPGYFSTESCIYTNQRIVLIVHYCGPKTYPARSVTLLARSTGMTQLYEEKIGSGHYDRAIRFGAFNGEMSKFISENSEDVTLLQVHKLYAALEGTFTPACWSMNSDTGYGCYQADENKFTDWFHDTLNYLFDNRKWSELFLGLQPNRFDL